MGSPREGTFPGWERDFRVTPERRDGPRQCRSGVRVFCLWGSVLGWIAAGLGTAGPVEGGVRGAASVGGSPGLGHACVTVAATPTEGRWPGVQPWRCRGRSVAQDKSFHLSVSSRPYLQDGGLAAPVPRCRDSRVS